VSISPGLIVKTGYLGFLGIFSVAENIFSGDPDDPGNPDGYFLKISQQLK
jgi:hypothetical protein